MLPTGTLIDAYEILGPLGRGGMGEVYKARDTRVDRVVAVKVLPSSSAGAFDAEGRFQREARALAALSHPRICSLFEFTRYDGRALLVMEYLEGQSLSARLGGGGMALHDALRVAVEVADGLAAAHRAGLVHRDLKPGNVMLTKSGAKLLDFGLAKPVPRSTAADDQTMTASREPMSQVGLAVGTLPYMAPEQLEGGDADARTDIWALGCVVYEMVTGRRAFEGATPAALSASILGREPSDLPPGLATEAPALDRVIRKCLAKDPERRWQSAADLRDELAWIAGAPGATAAVAAPRSRGRWMVAALATAASITVAAAAGWFLRDPPKPSAPSSPTRQFDITVPRLSVLEGQSLSPDGSHLAFIGPAADGVPVLWLRSMINGTVRVLPETRQAELSCPPFWSRDGRFVAFAAQRKLRRIDINGGPSQPIADLKGQMMGGDWAGDGTLLLGTYQLSKTHGLHRVAADGSSLSPVLPLGPAELVHALPRFLPDGRRFVFLSWAPEERSRDICVASLDDLAPRCLGLKAHYFVGLTTRHLLFARGDVLYAQPFDIATAQVHDVPIVIAEGLARDRYGKVSASVAGDALLIYQQEVAELRQLVWMGRDGRRIGTLGEAVLQTGLDMTDDGNLVAVERRSAQGSDVWLIDVRRGVTTKVDTRSESIGSPVLSGDGLNLTFLTREAGRPVILEQPIQGGTRRRLFEYGGEGILILADRSRDGRQTVIGLAERTRRVTQLISASAGEPVPIAEGNVALGRSRLSPDGRWVAYQSGHTGQPEVYVTPTSRSGEQWQVSAGGGQHPEWRTDGSELFYVALDGTMMAAPIRAAARFEVDAARPLFKTPLSGRSLDRPYAVTGDGQRFLVSVPREDDKAAATTMFRAVVNWAEALPR